MADGDDIFGVDGGDVCFFCHDAVVEEELSPSRRRLENQSPGHGSSIPETRVRVPTPTSNCGSDSRAYWAFRESISLLTFFLPFVSVVYKKRG